MGFAEVAHTADVAMRAWGRTVDELMAAAAQGMFSLAYGDGSPTPERQVEVTSPDLEGLLVDWLSELLYLSEVHGEVYDCFAVSAEPGWRLQGRARGRRLGGGHTKVKAVTYHGLTIEHEADEYVATIVFDT